MVLFLLAGCASTALPLEARAPEAPVPTHHLRTSPPPTRARLEIPAEYMDRLNWDPAAFEDTPVLFQPQEPPPVGDDRPERGTRSHPRRGWDAPYRAPRPFRTTGLRVTIQPASGHPMGLPGQAVGLPRHPVGLPGQAVRAPKSPVDLPGQAVKRPGQAVERPGQAVGLPGQAVGLPGQAVQQPGQAVKRPGQAVKRPGQAVELPGQAVQSVPKSAGEAAK